jgi:2-polyprenyl-3-methyl-5-hydroxy-6-metoxy-1,4-benzoquinol methylase
MSSSQQKTLEDFIALQNRNAISHAIRAVVELGVIAELRNGQRTAEQLAKELNVYPFALKQLLDLVANTELLEKYGDDYALSTIARLIPEPFLDFGDHHWKHLSLYVKTGAPLPICDEVPINDGDFVINKASEEWTLTPAALTAVKALDMQNTRKGASILEIGCGSGVFGVTLAHSDPSSNVVLLDNEYGLERAKTTVESIELQSQVSYVENEDPFNLENVPELSGKKFDLVMVANRIHRLTGGECQRLFQQIRELLSDSGELAIIDIFPGQEKGDLSRSIFEFELGLRTSRGRLHDPIMLETVLKESGLGEVQFAHLPTAPFYWGLILSQRV